MEKNKTTAVSYSLYSHFIHQALVVVYFHQQLKTFTSDSRGVLSVMALQKGGPGARKVRGSHYYVSQKKAAEAGFGI